MKKIIIVTIILGILFFSCKKEQSDLKPIYKVIQLDNTQKSIISADNQFGFNILKSTFLSESTEKNIMVSPTSIALALAMTFNGADGSTKEAMQETLLKHGLSSEQVNQAYKDLIAALLSVDSKVTLGIANSIWYRNDFQVLNDFLQNNQNYYNAETSALDFNNPNALITINNWVAEKTNQKITKILEQIDPTTVMALINAIYFKGIWTYKFDKNKTSNSTFYLSNGNTTEVPMMVQEEQFKSYYTPDFIMLELPYGQGNYVMDVIMPRNTYTINDIVNQLDNARWNNMVNNLSENKLIVHFPRFKFAFEKSLVEILTQLGMGVAFSPVDANFSKINPNYNLYISDVFHKAFIEVNEDGTEAAAVTVVTVNYTSIIENEVWFNRPFLFAIREVSTGTIMFMGKVENPSQD